jgi:hypothetical protein
VVNLLVVRQFDGDFCRDEFGFAFRQPNFAKTAFPSLRMSV